MTDRPPTETRQGDSYDLRYSQGAILNATGSITQHFGLSVQEALALQEKVDLKPYTGECPYVGLRYFSEREGGKFFGREASVAELVERVRVARFVAVAGPSGSGKSSLVRAGLIYALKDHDALANSSNWLYQTLTPQRDPIEQLALAMGRAKWPELAEYVRRNARTNADMLHEAAESALSNDPSQRLVLFVDQFEEAFTQAPPEDAATFIQLITAAAARPDGRVTVLIALRSDFVSQCALYPYLTALINGQFHLVTAMRPDELRQAIVRPAVQVGLRIEPQLVEQIIADMKGEPGALPLMQFALEDLFNDSRTAEGVRALTLDGYNKQGGIESALGDYADKTFSALTSEDQAVAQIIFSRLISVQLGQQDTSRVAQLNELVTSPDDPTRVAKVVKKLSDARLLTTDAEKGQPTTVRIAHEKLIEAWPWLNELVQQNRAAIALGNQVSDEAQAWEKNGRDPSYLISGARLESCREELVRLNVSLSSQTQAYLDIAVASDEAERREKAGQQRREIEAAQKITEEQRLRADEQKRANKRLRQRAIVLGILFVSVGIVAAMALLLAQSSNRNAQIADNYAATAEFRRNLADTFRSRELAFASQSQLGRNSQLALLLAIESARSSPTFEAEDALRKALAALGARTVLEGHTHWILSARFSTDGQRILTLALDGTARMWSAATGQELFKVVGRGSMYDIGNQIIDYSNDGLKFATLVANGVQIWDAEDGKPLTKIDSPQWFDRVEFSPDGKRILLAGMEIQVWDIEHGKLLLQIERPSGTESFQRSAFSPDGRQIVIAGGFKPMAQVLDIETKKVTVRVDESDHLEAIGFSPDGKRFFTIGGSWNDPYVRIWDVANGRQITKLSGHKGFIALVSFSPDSKRILTASDDQTTRVWNGETGVELLRLAGHQGLINDAQFSPDGKQIVTAGDDGTARIWDAETAQELSRLQNSQYYINSARFSPDGVKVVTASSDQTAEVYLVRIQDLLILAQERVVRPFSCQERELYLREKNACPTSTPSLLPTPPKDFELTVTPRPTSGQVKALNSPLNLPSTKP